MQAAEEDERTQQEEDPQEEDSRWAAEKRKEGMIALNPFAVDKQEGVYALDGTGREVGVGVRGEVKDFRFIVVKETHAAFVFDGTGWWDHAYSHDKHCGLATDIDEGWYWGMSPRQVIKFRDRQC